MAATRILSTVMAFFILTSFISASASSKDIKKSVSLSLDEKIGQLLMVPYSGQFVNTQSEYFKKLKDLVKDKKIGG